MAAKIIDGKQIAADIREELKTKVQQLKAKGITPGLAVILVGQYPPSVSYVTAKERACEEIGVYSSDNRLPENTKDDDVVALIKKLNDDPKIHGILVQLPMPKHINELKVLSAIDPAKDVDAAHPTTMGKMVLGQKAFLSCTPHGVVQMLLRCGVKLDGAEVVIVGRSNLVGKPLANILMQKSTTGNATVTICHTSTKDIAAHTKKADIVVAAIGKPGTITPDMIKPGAVVIDVGITRVDDASKKSGFRIVGDVDFEGCSKVASLITPVPGGVGPMTITMLLFNTVESAAQSK
jgi:methylenetetrahydrofolate dehydrogenase (NADP+)/methenyltetrahydrofolate cyclohydrolase